MVAAVTRPHSHRCRRWRLLVTTLEFCCDDRRLLVDVTQFIGAALKARNAAIVVAAESHRNTFFTRLRTQGVDAEVRPLSRVDKRSALRGLFPLKTTRSELMVSLR